MYVRNADVRLVREVQALPLISANMSGGSGLNRMYTFHSNVMYVYVQVSERMQIFSEFLVIYHGI